jgi:hypothetical protein
VEAEGWYRDPYGIHDARWISGGRPTNLVRDDGIETRDEPPPLPITEPLVESTDMHPRPGEGDVRRADDGATGSKPFSRQALVDAVSDDADAHLHISSIPL